MYLLISANFFFSHLYSINDSRDIVSRLWYALLSVFPSKSATKYEPGGVTSLTVTRDLYIVHHQLGGHHLQSDASKNILEDPSLVPRVLGSIIQFAMPV